MTVTPVNISHMLCELCFLNKRSSSVLGSIHLQASSLPCVVVRPLHTCWRRILDKITFINCTHSEFVFMGHWTSFRMSNVKVISGMGLLKITNLVIFFLPIYGLDILLLIFMSFG